MSKMLPTSIALEDDRARTPGARMPINDAAQIHNRQLEACDRSALETERHRLIDGPAAGVENATRRGGGGAVRAEMDGRGWPRAMHPQVRGWIWRDARACGDGLVRVSVKHAGRRSRLDHVLKSVDRVVADMRHLNKVQKRKYETLRTRVCRRSSSPKLNFWRD